MECPEDLWSFRKSFYAGFDASRSNRWILWKKSNPRSPQPGGRYRLATSASSAAHFLRFFRLFTTLLISDGTRSAATFFARSSPFFFAYSCA